MSIESEYVAFRADKMCRQQRIETNIGAKIVDNVSLLHVLHERPLKFRLCRSKAISGNGNGCPKLQTGPDASLYRSLFKGNASGAFPDCRSKQRHPILKPTQKPQYGRRQ